MDSIPEFLCSIVMDRKDFFMKLEFSLVFKIYIELAGYDRYNGHIETKRRDGL
ncbi:MAG: hypothetical protein HFH15_15540 [Ruminococcus sp.]|jgi:hypothetical protein|nr:hypothetical protein [Ruminococcus sp.]